VSALRFAILAVATASSLGAQVVGTLPLRSPFADLEDGQRIGVFAGWLVTGRDPLGVRPHASPILGARYDVQMGGPAYFTGRLLGIPARHDVLDPNRPSGDRRVGTASSNLIGADVGLTLAFTGERTWHAFQPLMHVGLGFVGGVGNRRDLGEYRPAPSVLYTWGFGARYATGKNAELRVDVSWLYFKLQYPETYRTTTASDNIPLRAEGTLTPMTGNRALSVAWSWGVFR